MSNILVSLVLPIYNVEKYLERCMKSIINQTYQNLEIILVDDGSTDSCPELCDEWEKRDSRVVVIHKTNAGLGMARNTGIDVATGKYIYFIDSDDFIEQDTIKQLVEIAEKNCADVVTFGFNTIDYKGHIVKTTLPSTAKSIYEGKEILEYFLPAMIAPDPHTGETTNLWISAWASMFSLKMIKNTGWRYVSERQIISEDVYSHLGLYKYVTKVAVVPKAFYNYCENDTSSLTRTFRMDRYEKNSFFYQACIQQCDELGYGNKIRERLMYPFWGNTIGWLKRIAISDLSPKQKKDETIKILDDQVFQDVVRKMNTEQETLSRKILIYAIKKRMFWICRCLIKYQASRTLK